MGVHVHVHVRMHVSDPQCKHEWRDHVFSLGDRRLAAVQLVDAHLCTDAGKYMSALLLCLSTMLHLELPHVNLLSKMDLLPSYGPLDFNLDFYTEVLLPNRPTAPPAGSPWTLVVL